MRPRIVEKLVTVPSPKLIARKRIRGGTDKPKLVSGVGLRSFVTDKLRQLISATLMMVSGAAVDTVERDKAEV